MWGNVVVRDPVWLGVWQDIFYFIRYVRKFHLATEAEVSFETSSLRKQ